MPFYKNQKIERLSEQPYEFKFGEYIAKGWWIFQQKMALFVVYTLFSWVILALCTKIPFVTFLLVPPFAAGFYLAAHKISRGESLEFSTFFKGFNDLGQLVAVGFVSTIYITAGYLCFIIPGVYLTGCYFFSTHLVIFEKMEFNDAMESSRKVVTNNWFPIFGFIIVVGLLAFSGFILFYVGALVSCPVALCASYAAFEDVFGLNSDEEDDFDIMEHLVKS